MGKLLTFLIILGLQLGCASTSADPGKDCTDPKWFNHPWCLAPGPSPTPSSTPTPTPSSSSTPSPTPLPTPSPSTTPTPAPSPTPVADWALIFEDQFSVPVAEGQFLADGRWSAYPYPWPDTSGHGRYDPNIISVHDGTMDMHLRQINGEWRTAAPAPRAVGYRTSMRIEVRFRADPVVGWKTSWLLWPQASDCFGVFKECWPRDGEVDFPEGNLNSTISAFMHRQGATVGSDQDVYNTSVTYVDWHTAVTEWDAGQRAAFYLDGVLIGESTNRVPEKAMRMVLQTETVLSSQLPVGPAHVYVDYLKVWTRP